MVEYLNFWFGMWSNLWDNHNTRYLEKRTLPVFEWIQLLFKYKPSSSDSEQSKKL